MTEKRAALSLTPAQARAVNSALALLEAEIEGGEDSHESGLSVVRRTRAVVFGAMERAGIRP